MRWGTALLILGAALLVVGVVYFFLLRQPPAGGDNRPWYEKGLDAIAPDRLKVGYAGFGIDLAF